MSMPITEIFKESYKHVLSNKLNWFKVALAPFIISIIGSTLDKGADFEALGGAENTVSIIFFSILSIVFSVVSFFAFYINGYRYGILNEGGDKWWTLPLNMRLVKMIVYGLIGFLILIVEIALVYALPDILNIILAIILILLSTYAIFRLSLLFPFVALDRKMAARESWRVMKSHVLSVFLLCILLALPILGIVVAGLLVIGLGYWLTPILGLGLVVLFGIPLMFIAWLLGWAVFSKGISFVYLYLTKESA